ncbi:MAG: hypothetical protein ACLFUF_08130 [Opitutales bacterium]
MLEKDADGRLKRIEYRGKHLRASRTGGVALRAQTKAAGINLTANTNRGMRVSTRVAKGTQTAFQNGRFILRGRYGDGPTKLNLSKSGVSVSSKTDIGTINWVKPGYSSAKIGGIQVRGKNAVYLHMIVGLIQMLVYFFIFLAHALVLTARVACQLSIKAWTALQRAWALPQQKKIRAVEDEWLCGLEGKDPQLLRRALDLVFLHLARGQAINESRENETAEHSDSEQNEAETMVSALLRNCPLKAPLNLEVLFSCLAETYAKQAGDAVCLEHFLDLDAAAVASGGRNRLQERLLAVYADVCGIDLSNDANAPEK